MNIHSSYCNNYRYDNYRPFAQRQQRSFSTSTNRRKETAIAAKQVFHPSKKSKKNFFSQLKKYNEKIFNCAKARNLEGALVNFNKIRKPNASSYAGLINAYINVGYYREAIDSFSKMKDVGCQPYWDTYSGIIKAYTKISKHEKAVHLVEQLRCRYLESYTKNYRPNITAHTMSHTVMYTISITAYAEAGYFQEAINFFNQMPVDHKNTKAYNAVINACRKKGQLQKAIDFFDQMRKEQISPDACTYTILINACKEARDIRAIFFSSEIEKNIKPDKFTYAASIRQYLSAGHLARAHAAFNRMKQAGIQPGRSLDTDFIEVYIKNKKLTEAFDFIRKRYKCAGELGAKTCSNLGRASNHHIIHYMSNDDIEQALILFKKMRDTGIQLNRKVFNDLRQLATSRVAAYLKEDNIKQALIFFQKMFEANIRLQEGYYPWLVDDAIKWITIYGGFNEKSDIQLALDIFIQMSKVNISLSKYDVNWLIDTANDHLRLATSKNEDLASNIAEKMIEARITIQSE